MHASTASHAHRTLDCPARLAVDLRKEIVHTGVYDWLQGRGSAIRTRPSQGELTREEDARRLAKKGLARDPSVGQPLPAKGGSQFDGYIDGDTMRDICGCLAFTDGACSRPFHPALARAAWATAFVDNEGAEIGLSYGPVPQIFPKLRLVGRQRRPMHSPSK